MEPMHLWCKLKCNYQEPILLLTQRFHTVCLTSVSVTLSTLDRLHYSDKQYFLIHLFTMNKVSSLKIFIGWLSFDLGPMTPALNQWAKNTQVSYRLLTYIYLIWLTYLVVGSNGVVENDEDNYIQAHNYKQFKQQHPL